MQSWPALWIMSQTEGTTLLLVSKYLFYPVLSSRPAPTSHSTPPAHPPPIDAIRDILGIELNYLKNQQC